MGSRTTTRIASGKLATLVGDCFRRLGLSAEDAAAVGDVLVDADLRGVPSHGVVRVPDYMRRVRAGAAGGTPGMRELRRAGPLVSLDAGAALGPAAAAKATGLLEAVVKEDGIGLIALRNSSHFGMAGYYARRAAGAGMVAVVTTNGPANMAPHGSSEPFLGTNALSIGVPLAGGEQFVLDMSCSVAARGRIIRAQRLREPIAAGLAINANGSPTTDPAEALAGAVLPFAGPKGSGLALAISLLVGILAGAAFDDEVIPMSSGDPRPQGLGQLFLGVDPWRLGDRDRVESRLLGLIDRLHRLRPAPGFDRVLFPGERGERERRRRLEFGIPLEAAELEAIARECDALGYEDLASRARTLVDAR